MAVSDNGFTLDQAIATHPALWEAMGVAWKRHQVFPDDCCAFTEVLTFLHALCIVGGFTQEAVRAKLREDFP